MIDKHGLERKEGINNDELMAVVLLYMILVSLILLIIIFPELRNLWFLFLVLIISDIALINKLTKKGKKINDDYNRLLSDGIYVKARINHDNSRLSHDRMGSIVAIECSWFDEENSRLYFFNGREACYGMAKYGNEYKNLLQKQQYVYVLLDPLNYNNYHILLDNLFENNTND